MHETSGELRELQRLLDRSAEQAGAHLRSIFQPGKKSLSAKQLATFFQGIKDIATATVTSKGEPRVAPTDAALIHGKFYVSTDLRSFRARHLKSRPGISLCYFEGSDLAIIVHGKARILGLRHRDFSTIDAVWRKHYGQGLLDFSKSGIYIRVDPVRMFTFASNPARFPAS